MVSKFRYLRIPLNPPRNLELFFKRIPQNKKGASCSAPLPPPSLVFEASHWEISFKPIFESYNDNVCVCKLLRISQIPKKGWALIRHKNNPKGLPNLPLAEFSIVV